MRNDTSNMNEFQFIILIKNRSGRDNVIQIGYIIELLVGNITSWSNVIRALLIDSTEKDILISYLIKKLNYCRNHPNNPEGFLDPKRKQIFKALEIK